MLPVTVLDKGNPERDAANSPPSPPCSPAVQKYVQGIFPINVNLINSSSSLYERVKNGGIKQEDVDLFIHCTDRFDQEEEACFQARFGQLSQTSEKQKTPANLGELYFKTLTTAHHLSLSYLLGKMRDLKSGAKVTQEGVNDALFLNKLVVDIDARIKKTVQRVLKEMVSARSLNLCTDLQLREAITQHLDSSREMIELFLQYINQKCNSSLIANEDLDGLNYLNLLRKQMYERTLSSVEAIIEFRARALPRFPHLTLTVEQIKRLLAESLEIHAKALEKKNQIQLNFTLAQLTKASRGQAVNMQSGHTAFFEQLQTIFSELTQTVEQLSYLEGSP